MGKGRGNRAAFTAFPGVCGQGQSQFRVRHDLSNAQFE